MDLMDYRRKIIMSSPHLSHAEGAVATFPDGTDLPLKSLLVNIEPVQSGSGDPSPSNERPISGWSAVNVTGTGKNLLGGLTLGNAIVNAVGNTSYSNFASDSTGDYVTIKASSYTNHKAFTGGVKFKSNTQYTVILSVTRNIVGTSVNSNITVVYTDGTVKTIAFAESTETEIVTVAFVTDGTKTVKQIETAWGGGIAKVYYENCGIFEGVLTADGFEPYTGTSLTIALGQTVYGGTLNVLTGDLVVDMAIVDLGTLSWNYATDNQYPVFYANKDNFGTALPDYTNGKTTVMCSDFKAVTNKAFSYFANGDTSVDFSIAISATGTIQRVLVRDSRYTDKVSFKTAMNGVQLVYKLATPITYHLDPQTVRSLVGQNNIFADTGNVALEYWAHP